MVKIVGGRFDLEDKEKRLRIVNNLISSKDFWNNKEDANKIIKEYNYLKDIVNPVNDVYNKIKSNIEILDNIEGEDYKEYVSLILEEYGELKKQVDDLKLNTYLSGKYDKNNCILEIHAGAGGTESCDWVNMLYRMYLRYGNKVGYRVNLMDSLPGDEVGYRRVTLLIEGINAYGYLKGEKGIHRLVRISPFDSNKRRHTSFAAVEVIPDVKDDNDIKISDSDLRIDIYRSSGPGGQGVNTTDSAVRITHLPTGIVVTCQNERSQIQNKEHCLEILRSKLYVLEQEKKDKELNLIKGEEVSNGFGSAKRSYVMCPYTLVKDNDTNYEEVNVNKVLDGDIEEFIKEELKMG